MADDAIGLDIVDLGMPIDWHQVAAAGYAFAMFWTSSTGALARDWQRAVDAGLLPSAIHRVDASRPPAMQMRAFLARLGGLKPDLPFVLAVPTDWTALTASSDSPVPSTAAFLTACSNELMHAGHRRPIILTTPCRWNAHVDADHRWRQHDLWVHDARAAQTATASPRLPRDWPAWRFWRCAEGQRVPGVARPVSQSRFAGSEAALLAYAERPPRRRELPQLLG